METVTKKTVLEIFEHVIPDPQDPEGERTKTYYFTSADRPVTYNGQQYIPLSIFDLERWGLNDVKEKENSKAS